MSAETLTYHLNLPRQRLRTAATKIIHLRHLEKDERGPVERAIKVICISDTHNLQPPLPVGDILIHAGDLTEWGTFEEIQTHLDWLSSQPHTHKVLIAGNHDLLFDAAFLQAHPEHQQKNSGRTKEDLELGGIKYLQDQSITLSFPEKDGREITIYGSPWTPRYGTSAFQYPKHVDRWHKLVPLNTDILVTHGPPAGHLDGIRTAGCPDLLEEVRRVRPKLMVFGHIHVARGEELVAFDRGQILYEDIRNGSRGWEAIPLLGLAVLWSRVRQAMGMPPSASTRMINATIVDGMAKDVALPAFVAHI